MQVFIKRPSIDRYVGVKVTKDTVLEFENENVKQVLRDLVLRTCAWVKGENYESVNETKIFLEEGDVLIFEEKGRGYIMPVEPFVTIAEAIDDLECIKDLG